MSNENKEKLENPVTTEKHKTAELGRVGSTPVGPFGIIITASYLILLSLFLIYGVIQFWPPVTIAKVKSSIPSLINFLFWKIPLSEEVRLILIVALTGALGGLVHALRSLYWYVGNRALVFSWLPKYILLPFVGAALGLVFYFVIRGGFFSPEATVQVTSPFGFAALSGLVGMFSEQAVLKLKELAETLLTKPKPGEDAMPEDYK